LQLKPALKPVEARPRDMVVVVDTSASQAGKFLDASRKSSSNSCAMPRGRPHEPVGVQHAPRHAPPVEGLEFAGNRDNTAAMLRALEAEYPSGAVDLKFGLDNVLKDFDGKVARQQVIVYLGDARALSSN